MPKNTRQLNQWLQEGIIATKAGQLEQARFRLLDVVEQDQTNETAWYWLYQAFERRDDQRICLENLIILNPDNHWAKQELLNLLEARPPAQPEPQPEAKATSLPDQNSAEAAGRSPPRPVTLKLVTTFWFGISTIFLGSGIISVGIWLTFLLNSQDIATQNAQLFQYFEVLIGISFIVGGVLGLYVAVMLLLRSMIGLYGSVLLSLGLLLVGPTVSLITTPPNYVTLICTGGISGMIMLLTLASQPGFEKITQDDST
jgi:tetratricopeptide (TPR) repeat protein